MAEGITALPECWARENKYVEEEEIAKINERREAGFSTPFVKRNGTDVELIWD
jgi:hypothetical protein